MASECIDRMQEGGLNAEQGPEITLSDYEVVSLSVSLSVSVI